MYNKQRFLITTPDERILHSDAPLLLLGQWCITSEFNRLIEGRDVELVAEYGFESEMMHKDYCYVQVLRQELLIELKDSLNRHHGTTHSLRYWRILLGPWLYSFVSIIFDRWQSIRRAVQNYQISGTILLEYPSSYLTPTTFDDFNELWQGDIWNHYVLGKILNELTDIPCERIAVSVSNENRFCKTENVLISRKKQLKHKLLSALESVLFGIPCLPTDALFVNTYLSKKDEYLLQLQFGQVPRIWKSPSTPHTMRNNEERSRFNLDTHNYQGFDRFIRAIISEQIPTLYLEGYQSLRKKVDELTWPDRPKVIFTANSFYADEVFKAWTAAKTEQGVPYVIAQHGGYYGTSKYPHHTELNETITADRYLTWGWTDNNKKCYPCVAMTSVGKSSGASSPSGGLLLVATYGPRYHREPWERYYQNDLMYIKDLFQFVSLLPQYIFNQIIVRPAPNAVSNGKSHNTLWKERFPTITVDSACEKIEPLIQKSRLFLYTYNSTGFLQTLARNIPTIIFWDKKYNELRPSAEPYYDQLKSVGIFHETPESASAQVAEVWNDVAGWWNQPLVQNARVVFCEQYARMPRNPIRTIRNALSTV